MTYREFFGVAPSPPRFFVTLEHSQSVGVPAYINGFATQDNMQASPPFPYLTVPIIRPGTFNQAMVMISIFDRHAVTPGFTPRIYEIQEQLEQMIPIGGVVLRVGDNGEAIWIQRGTPFFPESIGDPNDRLVTQGLCSIVVRDYIL